MNIHSEYVKPSVNHSNLDMNNRFDRMEYESIYGRDIPPQQVLQPKPGDAEFIGALSNEGTGESGKTIENLQLTEMKNILKNGEIKENNIIAPLDENTQVIFRNDTGANAHPIHSQGYDNPVNHYNIEIQVKTQAGKWKSKWSYHIIFDEFGVIIDYFE